jgi:hypothetical protein
MTDTFTHQLASQGASSLGASVVHRPLSLPTFGKDAWRSLKPVQPVCLARYADKKNIRRRLTSDESEKEPAL